MTATAVTLAAVVSRVPDLTVSFINSKPVLDGPTGSRGGARAARGARSPLRRRSRPPTTVSAPPADHLKEAPGVRTLITRARSALLSSFDTELEPFGVTGAQFEVLKNIARNHGETAASLCRALHHDTGSMTRMLDRLQEKGLVSRERGTSDRRVVHLRLTHSGQRLIPKVRPALRRALRRHLSGFSPAEIESLKRYLSRLITNGERRDAGAR
jgi:MarR family multiple antibiotic resistance transcriptional regulator